MEYREIDDPSWTIAMANLEEHQDKQWVCDFAAIRANNMQPLGTDAALAFLARPNSMVVAALDRDELVAYVVADDDREGRGGCRGRWLTIEPVDGYQTHEILRGMLDVLAAKYGWVWGRMTNPRIQQLCRQIGDRQGTDKALFTYRRP